MANRKSATNKSNENWPHSRLWNGLALDWHPEFDQAVQQTVSWYKLEAARGIVLAGGYGCGKSSIAGVVYRAAGGPTPHMIRDEEGRWIQIRQAVMYSEPELLEAIRTGYGSGNNEASLIRLCREARVLILDDLGAAHYRETSQSWYEDIVWRILNKRHRTGKKTMVTTNLSPSDLKLRIGGRATSRLKELVTPDYYCTMFNVPDYRRRRWQPDRPVI